MAPREKLTKEQIEQTALQLLREGGLEQINARALATRLGCSTMPLFRHFESMEALRGAALQGAVELYSGYVREGLSEAKPFRGVGRAYIRFAREEPQLFRLFFMTPAGTVPGLPEVDPMRGSALQAAGIATGSEPEGAERILLEMWLFVHGIATSQVTETIALTDEEINEVMTDVFSGLTRSDRQRKEETNESEGN